MFFDAKYSAVTYDDTDSPGRIIPLKVFEEISCTLASEPGRAHHFLNLNFQTKAWRQMRSFCKAVGVDKDQ